MQPDILVLISFGIVPVLFIFLSIGFKEDKLLKWAFLILAVYFLADTASMTHYALDLNNGTTEAITEGNFQAYTNNSEMSLGIIHDRLDSRMKIMNWLGYLFGSLFMFFLLVEGFELLKKASGGKMIKWIMGGKGWNG